jgi:hypothetical protein
MRIGCVDAPYQAPQPLTLNEWERLKPRVYVRGFCLSDKLGSALFWARRSSPLSWMKALGQRSTWDGFHLSRKKKRKSKKGIGREGYGCLNGEN